MTTVLRLTVLLAVALLMGCSQPAQQQSDYTEQENLVNTSFTYLKQLDWPSYATIMHPNTLADFRMILMPGIEKLVMASNTDSIMIYNKAYNSAAIQGMPVDSFFIEMMRLMESLTPEFAATYQNINAEILGAISEGDTLIHVISRTDMNFSGRVMTEMDVQTLRQSEGEWMLEPSNKITGIAMILRQGLPQ